MMILRYGFVFSLSLLYSLCTFSQELQISQVEKTRGSVNNVVVIDTNSFVLITTEFQGIRTYQALRSYSETTFTGTQRLPDQYNGKDISYKSFEVLNDTLSGFFCVTNTETFDYYLQQYDSLCFAVNDPKFIISIPRFSNKNWENGNVLISPDKSTYLIYCTFADEVLNKESFYYAGFSVAGHKSIYENEIQGMKLAPDVSFEDVWLMNNGKVLVSEYVFFEKLINERKSNRRMEAVRLHVSTPHSKSPRIITLVPPNEEYLTHVECVVSDNSVSGTGVYCIENDHFNGLFSFFVTDTVSSETVVKLLPRLESIELSGLDLRFSNRHEYPAQSKKYVCNDMKLLDISAHGDSTVYVWERIATMVHHDVRSYLSTDLLIEKVYKDSILYCKVIPKSTVSEFEEGKNVRACVRRPNDNEVIIYFNDYIDLYNSAGEYLAESPKLKRNRIIKPPLGVVELRYHLTDNTYQRNMLFDNTVFEVAATPVLWRTIDANQILLQFATHGKFRFAYWKY